MDGVGEIRLMVNIMIPIEHRRDRGLVAVHRRGAVGMPGSTR